MIRLTTRDPAEFRRGLLRGAKQIPFATSKALNTTAKDMQESHRSHHAATFNVRRRAWFRRAVKIERWARKTTPIAVLAISPQGNDGSRAAITRHESGGKRTPFRGRTLLVPLAARTGRRQNVRATNRPEAFNLRPLPMGSGSRYRIYQGDRRTFAFRDPRTGSGAIIRRRRRGSSWDGTETLYQFAPRTPVSAVLQFHEISRKVFDRRFLRHFAEEYRKALQTAR